jgi:3-deoxy-D-manno-octulosonic acid kinase
VATREIVGGRDLGATLVDRHEPVTREVTLAAVAELLRALGRCGAVHPDLNVKNVLLAPDGGRTRAFVLDVDRVRFAAPGDPRVTEANVRRLNASARKWRAVRGARIDDADLAWLAESARGAA